MHLHFELPATLSSEKFIVNLSDKGNFQLISRRYCIRTYYDSFDWRLWSNDILCEFNRSKDSSALILRSLDSGRLIGSSEMAEVPPFPKQLNPGIIQDTLQSILDIRALMAVCTIDYEVYHLNLLNEDKKTVLRLIIEDYEFCNSRVQLQPIKGYDKAAEDMVNLLTRDMNLSATDKPVLLIALQLQGRKPKDYSAKLNFNLDPAQRADMAVKIIFSRLLKTIKDNEQGTIADIDSEFLHDFRVSVRRTRSGLSQLRGVLPDDITDYYADFFSWLGQATSPTRDLDVYLLSFDNYKACLPADIREDLNPLYDFMLEKKRKALQELVRKLQSTKYLTTRLEWEQYLKQSLPFQPVMPKAHLTIKELADLNIWKIYKRVIKRGEEITPHSPADSLHSLRKSCKKLRYLIEFFQNLYPDQQIDPLIKDLKALQDVLGEFQDCDVQERSLKLFSEEMVNTNTPANTFLAMGVLIRALDDKKCNARKHFSSRFERFKQKKNYSAFSSLFGGQD